ncbi:MAG: exo-alpha-sialidase [Akkermansia sp.]|nr:exo-alpha-sialidase [Akkermansia sp.]
MMKFCSSLLCAVTLLVAAPLVSAPACAQDEVAEKPAGKKKGKKKKARGAAEAVASSLPGKPATRAELAALDSEPYGRAVDVFVAGEGNPYASIRIPDIINANGTLVAMAEGRYQDTDQGQNDLIVAISKDGGRKWSKPVVAAASKGATFNNPCLIYDRNSRQIVLFFQRYPEGIKERTPDIPTGWEDKRCIRNFVCFSKNGRKWSKPKDVTEFTKNEGVTITCSGPNPGVQLTRGKHKGRLVVPLNEGPFGNWTLAAAYSDDGGKSWSIGRKSDAGRGINEVSIAETEEGGLLVVSRAWGGSLRKVAYSEDGGASWGPVNDHPELPSPNCQNGLTRYSYADDAALGSRGRILFSSPTQGRSKGVIKMSYDDGKTWPVSRFVGDGPFAYSVLCPVKPGVAGVLFEVNGAPIRHIRFAPFSISWLTGGEDDGLSK